MPSAYIRSIDWVLKGNLIADNFLLAQEIITGMKKKNRGENMAIKLDMTKAYDKVP